MCDTCAQSKSRVAQAIGLGLRLVGALILTALAVAAGSAQLQAQEAVAASGPYVDAARQLEAWIAREVEDKRLPALSIALIDDQHVVWAKGFGQADRTQHRPATAESVYRVGSVSKLFTDVAVMQLVEQGLVDLDAPVQKYLPEFAPKNPFPSGKAITLRQLMAHRSGLVREPPVGHYFDSTEPSLADTVKSLNKTALIYEPETRTKYSNAAVAVVGLVLERVRKQTFSQALKSAVLDPLGLKHSSVEVTPALAPLLAKGVMWTYDGRTTPAPTFALGTAPAGNLYSTVLDLGRFMSMVFADGKGPGGPILKPETLQKMLQPQFARQGQRGGFGLGFVVGDVDGHRSVGHNGAAYGFATQLVGLPEEKLGVAVIASRDCANAATDHIGEMALRVMLAAKNGQKAPALESTTPIPTDLARRLEGKYGQGDRSFELTARANKLSVTFSAGGPRGEIRKQRDSFIIDDPLMRGPRFELNGDQLLFQGVPVSKAPAEKPKPAPERWMGLIGEYGWDHNVLYILERDGKLYALIEWFFAYPLEEISPDIFKFPGDGLYESESLRFTRDANGRATQVIAAEVPFLRRPIPGEGGVTFHITPRRPIAGLRQEALADHPPVERGDFRKPDLVELSTLDPSIKRDIRYATTNNFMQTPLYSLARAYMQRSAAEALKRAHEGLKKQGYGLLIHDAYRPWYVTKMFWEATPDADRIFVADPSKGSRHNRGCAVDLTLYDLASGQPAVMVGGYDEFSFRSFPEYPGGTSLQRWQREVLRHAMEDEGFVVNINEWWHFDFKDWRSYPILNIPFEELGPG
ncbi:serine hydrolase [Singulisphaera sp. PoT]|uniref:serine hydrolase n=1 Tax=Singulisphaera sp. PoT TaxID=3411797 RepID=UPI003BF58CAF